MILEARSLSVNLGKAFMLSYPDISLSAGDRLLVSGASGSGKTTLLNAVAGLTESVVNGTDTYCKVG